MELITTNAIPEYVKVVEDSLKSLGALSNEALCCVAIALFCFCLKMVLTNGRKHLRKWIPVVSIVMVGPLINWALWAGNIVDGSDVAHGIRNVWVTKLIYGGLYGFLTWTTYETVLKPITRKIFGKQILDAETEIITKPDA